MLSKDYTGQAAVFGASVNVTLFSAKGPADCRTLRRRADHFFLKGTRTQKTGTSSSNVKEAEFLRSYLRPLFSCRPRFAASSPAGDNWRNALRVVKRTPSVENVSVSPPEPLHSTLYLPHRTKEGSSRTSQ